MNDAQIIERLIDTGHMYHPFGTGSFASKDMNGLTLQSEACQLAIRSWQDFMVHDIDRLAMAHHGRQAMADGELGPCGLEVMSLDRCGCPDYSGGGDARPAVGTGNWPKCWDIGDYHAAKVKINERGMPSFLAPVFDEVWDTVVAAYEQIGLRFIRTEDDDRNIDFTFVNNRSGWIGLAIVGHGRTCGGSPIWCKYRANYHPSNVKRQWANLIIHELGHNCGLSHSRGGLMNPVLTGGPPTWRNDPSERLLGRLYGGKPIPSDDPDDKQIVWDFQGLKSSATGDEVWTPLFPPILMTKRMAKGHRHE